MQVVILTMTTYIVNREESMASDARERMVKGAVQLLAKRGLQATSFSEVLDLTGAPRGSVYHHFPQGKDQLVAEAIELASTRALERLASKRGARADEVARHFLDMWRELLGHTRFSAGCAVVAVTVAADSPDLLRRAAEIFRTWRRHLAELLAEGGLGAEDAARLAATLIAGSEGAVILCRAEQSMEALDLVAEQILRDVQRALRK
jgi:TetR/AcrR family transcriptional regulator, lmrAB and yxaGH operons repressor